MGKLGKLGKLITKQNVLNAGLVLIIVLSAIQIYKLVTAAKETFENAYPASYTLEGYEDQGEEEEEGFEEEEEEGFEDGGEEEEEEEYEEMSEEEEAYEDLDETFEADAVEQFGAWGDGSSIEGYHDEGYTPLLMEPASGSNANAMFSAPTL